MKSRLTLAFWFIVWTLPALWIGILIYRYGVDIPHGDQWFGMCPMFAKADAGTLRFADFIAQHNEHRLLFPRLIMYSLARLTHWNVRVELFVVWFLGCLCALNLVRTAALTGFTPATRPWTILAVNALVFSPIGFENWLWGFQIGFLLPVVCFFAITWTAGFTRSPWNYLATIALCFVSTFSIGTGFTYWILALPLLVFRDARTRSNREKPWLIAYAICFALSTVMYFVGYEKPEQHPSPSFALRHPFQTIQCTLAVLGNPFAHGTALDTFFIAQIMGAALVFVLVVVVAAIWFWRDDPVLRARALPWLSLAGFACINVLAIAVGRVGLGAEITALTSRYTPFSTALPLSLLFLVPLVFQKWQSTAPGSPRSRARIAMISLTTIFVLLHVLGAAAITGKWEQIKHFRLVKKSIVLCATIVDDPELWSAYVQPDAVPVKPLVSLLDRLGYLRPGLVHTDAIDEIAATSPMEPQYYGAIEQSGRMPDGRLLVAGSAVLPEKMRAADSVLLTCDDPTGKARIVAMAAPNVPRPELVDALHSTEFGYSGWVKHLDVSTLPRDARTIRAWAFDAETKIAYPMHGAANVN